jgi:hypothetical protein
MQNGFYLSSRHDYFSLYEELGKEQVASVENSYKIQARKFLEQFRSQPRPYYSEFSPDKQPISKKRQFKFLLPGKLVKSVGGLIYEVKKFSSGQSDYTDVRPWHFLFDRIIRKARNFIGTNDLIDKIEPGEKFAYFPLQYEPEVSLHVQAHYFSDQIHAIKLIADSLPLQWKLYVKEHPQMVEFRPRSFYKEIKKIPNVKLISPAIKSFELIEKSSLVTTICDTGGFEACLLKKPVVTLGGHFINDLSFVKNSKTPEELPNAIKSQIENWHYNETEIEQYLAALIRESVRVDLIDIWYHQKDFETKKKGMKPLAEKLLKTNS